MNKTYACAPGYKIQREGPELVVGYARQVKVFRVPVASKVLDLLDASGAFTQDIFSPTLSSDEVGQMDIDFIITSLLNLGAIREVSLSDPAIVTEMLQRAGNTVSLETAKGNMESSDIIIVGDSDLTQLVAQQLQRTDPHAQVTESTFKQLPSVLANKTRKKSIVIGAWTDYMSRTAHEFNTLIYRSLDVRFVLMCGNYDSQRYFIGPLIVPGVSACLNCWIIRYRSNLVSIPEEYRPKIDQLDRSNVSPPISFSAVLAAHVADMSSELRILRNNSGASRPGGYTVLNQNYGATGLERYVVHKVPRCEVCNSQATSYPQVWHHESKY